MNEHRASLDDLEQEEARLRERLAKIALVKDLMRELGIAPSGPKEAKPDAEPEAPPAATSTPQPEANRPAFDGTFLGLVSCYRQDERSGYGKLKHKVRLNYDNSFKRLIDDVGHERVGSWSAERVKAIYDENWAAGGKIAMGRSMVTKVRLLCSYGSTVLNDDDCTRLSGILSNMRIPAAPSKSDSERLTREQARAIRVTARQHFGWDSIALAQALQFELHKIRQADVIGEWVPLSEPGESDIVKGDEKWVRGLRWSDIDENMVLHATLRNGRQEKKVEYRLSRSQMALEELNRVPVERRKGPLVICEVTGLPWSANEFRRKWRIVAEKAGVPASVRNGEGPSTSSADDEPTEGIFG